MDKKAVQAKVNAVQADIDAALKQIAEKHGLPKLRVKSGSYMPNDGFMRFHVEGVLEGGKDKTEIQYDRYAEMLNLPKRGSSLTFGGKEYTIAGMNESKNLLVKLNGKTFKLNLLEARKALGIAEPAPLFGSKKHMTEAQAEAAWEAKHS